MVCGQVSDVASVVEIIVIVLLVSFLVSEAVGVEHSVGVDCLAVVEHGLVAVVVRAQEVIINLLIRIDVILVLILAVIVAHHLSADVLVVHLAHVVHVFVVLVHVRVVVLVVVTVWVFHFQI